MPEVNVGPAVAGPEEAEAAPDTTPSVEALVVGWWTISRAAVIGLLLGALAIPFLVAIVALRAPRWYPVLDLAMTELRLRDVGTSHTPLIGLPGRIGTLAQQGSHPGPASFYALAPLYRLFGSSGWAMQAATAVLHLAATGVALFIANRRGGVRLTIVMAIVLALLVRGYGMVTLVEPWNPYLPLLWWIVVLLAVWSVTDDDLAMAPVAVVAGSFCAQTHVPYLGLAVGLGVLVMVVAVVLYRAQPPGSDRRRRILRWGAVSLALGALLWTPALVDQLRHDPGNLRQLKDHFSTPPEPAVGLAEGVRLELLHLDAYRFATDSGGADGSLVDASSDPDGSVIPGVGVLAVWFASVAAAWRLRARALIRLHLVVGVGLVLAVISMTRIFGKVWFYLMLWSWGITALLFVAVGWTVALAVAHRLPAEQRDRGWRWASIALVVIMAIAVGQSTVDGARADPPAPTLSRALGDVLGPTAAAIDGGAGSATGHDGRYLVLWRDAYYFGSQGFGLVSELERRGFDVGVEYNWRVPVTAHRVIDRGEADAIVYLVTGVFVGETRAVPGAVEVAYIEPRSDGERAEFERLRADVIAELEHEGLAEQVPLVDSNLFGVSIDPRVPTATQVRMARMLELGEETAVFILPPDALL